MSQTLKCNWCKRRFTPTDEIKYCEHAGIQMKFHLDCLVLHVARTH